MMQFIEANRVLHDLTPVFINDFEKRIGNYIIDNLEVSEIKDGVGIKYWHY